MLTSRPKFWKCLLQVRVRPGSVKNRAWARTWFTVGKRKPVDGHMGGSLVRTALEKGLRNRRPAPGLVLHSDRGGQYVSGKPGLLIKKQKCGQSMGRADNVYDNAFTESLFSRLKAELLENGVFLSLEDARTEIFEYIEIYYNPVRRHSALGYRSPDGFEKNHHQNQLNLQGPCPGK